MLDREMPEPTNLYDVALVLFRERYHADLLERFEALSSTYPIRYIRDDASPEIVTELGKLSRTAIRDILYACQIAASR